MPQFSLEMFVTRLKAAGYDPTPRGLEEMSHDFQAARKKLREYEELGVNLFDYRRLLEIRDELERSGLSIFDVRELLELRRAMECKGLTPTAAGLKAVLSELERIRESIHDLPRRIESERGFAKLEANISDLEALVNDFKKG